MLYIEIIKVRDLDVLPNARYTQSHGKWAEKDRNFAVTLTIEPVFMRVTREGVKIIIILIALVLMFKGTIVDFVARILDGIELQGEDFDPAQIAK